MDLQHRIRLLVELGKYILGKNESWQSARQKAFHENPWFTPEFIELATRQIGEDFLEKSKLENWINGYNSVEKSGSMKNVGIVMAGNIPLVGFHDFLAVFLTGHKQTIKPSSKDNILIRHLVDQLYQMDPGTREFISFEEKLKGCDAYIATGSNNSARYFEYYFAKYPHVIRRNRTSVAILDSRETDADLLRLADDVYSYFGLGCRNITKIYVPEDYDFLPLLNTFSKYNYLADHNKYKNNYDYQLALLILNKKFYMTNGSLLVTENASPFSPISVLHFEYYKDIRKVEESLEGNEDIQCVVGNGRLQFGRAQHPGLKDYADGIDTVRFLLDL
ncbi:MAG: acyl-CoA reductase [Bacteroidetes bacterium]|nr:MAG: acyl-CoA reductase [Bacteroidota bacterium]